MSDRIVGQVIRASKVPTMEEAWERMLAAMYPDPDEPPDPALVPGARRLFMAGYAACFESMLAAGHDRLSAPTWIKARGMEIARASAEFEAARPAAEGKPS